MAYARGRFIVERMMTSVEEKRIRWMDLMWLLFIAGLAVLPPVKEIHKQLILLAIGLFQLVEGSLIAWQPRRGRYYAVFIKILLATLLLDHTGELGINSSYYPIYFLPIVTAAVYFGPVATLLWTGLAALAYCSFLIDALQVYEFTAEGKTELAIRILFFFLAAMVVNRLAQRNRRQLKLYQELSEQLQGTNAELRRVQDEARRSERLAALGSLSAGLAHEIRNPLGVIKGSAEMLARKVAASDPLLGELAGYITSEVSRLNALVAKFLDFARPSQLTLRPVDITVLVERALMAAQDQKAGARVAIKRTFEPALPPVRADEQLAEQVFVNLFVNALEALEGVDGPVLRVAIKRSSLRDLPGVMVAICDNGAGVPEGLREQIFNPFFTTKKSGVGLGLSLVVKIVDDHHGQIRLLSGANKGACFEVFLPTAEPIPAKEEVRA
jgi:two-component system sensor histidine kinase HydH